MIDDDEKALPRARRLTHLGALQVVLRPDDYGHFLRTVQRGRVVFDGRVVWNVNSTAQGGSVAETLISLLAYARGADIDARWVVVPLPSRARRSRGGIQDQIADGETGIPLDDPLEPAAYGAAVRRLLDDPAPAGAMGREAKKRVLPRFLGTRTLIRSIELYERYIGGQRPPGAGVDS